VKKKLAVKIKPRNPLVAPTLVRKAGKHAPDPKGVRRASNRKAEVEGEQVVQNIRDRKAD
jgi:hypothetical protein